MKQFSFDFQNNSTLIIEPVCHYFNFQKGDKVKLVFSFSDEMSADQITVSTEGDDVYICIHKVGVAFSYEVFLNGEFHDKDKCGL